MPVQAGAVAITGANGFIGSALGANIAAQGIPVIALARTRPGKDLPPGISFRNYSLESPINEGTLSGVSTLIHCAYAAQSVQNPEAMRINREGTLRLVAAARKARVAALVFISSLAAHPQAESTYGKCKLELESLFDPTKDLILRPGLVLGQGGLFLAMVRTLEKAPFIPLICGNRPLQTIHIDDLGAMALALITKGACGVYALAESPPVPMREFYRLLLSARGLRKPIIPFPFTPAFVIARISENLGIRLPLTTENLLGLKQMTAADPGPAIAASGITPRDCRTSLAAILS